jgi:uncharacterized protein (TIGR03435 family)
MTDLPDVRLLEQFSRDGSEEAFATLVERHIAVVHSVALRHTDNPQNAQDITQAVFIILTRKARTLSNKVVLAGWLYNTARLTAANFKRAEARRLRRDQEAFMNFISQEPSTDALWCELSPLLDQAIASLNTTERDALVLRFFQNKSMAEVGKSLRLTQNTAQKRVCRALEKLEKFFAKHGVTSTTAMIAQTISVHSVQAVPTALAKSITLVALVKGATASNSTLTLIKGALKIMAWSKAKIGIVAGVVVILSAATTTVTVTEIQEHRTYPWQTRTMNYALLMPPLAGTPGRPGNAVGSSSRIPPQVRILPAKYPSSPGGRASGAGGLIGLNQPALEVVKTAFGYDPHNIYSTNLVAELPLGSFDFISNLPVQRDDLNALQQELKEKWGVFATSETLDEDVMVLRVKTSSGSALKASMGQYCTMLWKDSSHRLECRHAAVPDFANLMASMAQFLFVDETGLTGFYDFDINCDATVMERRDWSALNAALEPLGLEMVPTNMPIEMRVIDKK